MRLKEGSMAKNPMTGTTPAARALQAAHARRVKAMKARAKELFEAQQAGRKAPRAKP
jgi:hypothetical protein